MNSKTYAYLWFKSRGASQDEIIRETGITPQEYEELERAQAQTLEQIKRDQHRSETIGPDFVRLTRYIYGGASAQMQGKPCPPVINPPSGELIPLPKVDELSEPTLSLKQAILQRRSLREYSAKPFTLQELSFMLWASCQVNELRQGKNIEITRRQVPSAGSRHPFECHLLINRVEGIPTGLYYYHPIQHGLILRESGPDIAAHVLEACRDQEMVVRSAFTLILSARPYRTAWRYQQRSYRYLYVDAGHVGQNVHLAAEALNAGSCMVGAFTDELLDACLGLDGIEEFAIYVMPVGKKP
ncbi:MAG: SagB/ThcOx family dehydrogenase [Candidatus Cloacimonadaceae bacterium]|jgi:SagB-type dehydrogenase family enzyme|nr:SagB/ThcOx family dehydrogenase [Candidatus Cloacimonadota bacterium]MDX9949258.1 SagB/ThcOx family dehydrogenase [Candidatus Syntrophosphaera sp.]